MRKIRVKIRNRPKSARGAERPGPGGSRTRVRKIRRTRTASGLNMDGQENKDQNDHTQKDPREPGPRVPRPVIAVPEGP